MTSPLAPLYTAHLFEPLHDALIQLLRGLTDDDWLRPTVAGQWRVRDVAAHLLDGQLRTLSAIRDGHLAPPDGPLEDYDDLVRFLDRLNAGWIEASRRLSPRVITELLTVVGPEVAATFSALPPHGPALFPVAWAGEDTSENWMHVGREYTEWWHHHMQIRDAVGAPGLFEPKWFQPLLDLSVRVLPHTYQNVEAAPGTNLVISVEGAGGGTWSLVRDDAAWVIHAGDSSAPDATIVLDPDTAWKTLYHALDPSQARAQARIEGEASLATPFFRARSVMVPRVSTDAE